MYSWMDPRNSVGAEYSPRDGSVYIDIPAGREIRFEGVLGQLVRVRKLGHVNIN